MGAMLFGLIISSQSGNLDYKDFPEEILVELRQTMVNQDIIGEDESYRWFRKGIDTFQSDCRMLKKRYDLCKNSRPSYETNNFSFSLIQIRLELESVEILKKKCHLLNITYPSFGYNEKIDYLDARQGLLFLYARLHSNECYERRLALDKLFNLLGEEKYNKGYIPESLTSWYQERK